MNRFALIFRHVFGKPPRVAVAAKGQPRSNVSLLEPGGGHSAGRWLLTVLFLLLAPLAGFGQISVGTTFGGVNFSQQGWGPLDPNGAAGPNHICQIVNTSLAIYTKGGQLIEFKDLSSFSGGAGIDPTVVYDTTVNRWVICSGLKDVFIAVSDTSDPTEGWSEFHTVNFPGAGDGGRFGFNASAYFLAYPDNPSTIIIDKASMLDKNNSTFTWYRWNPTGNKTLMMDDTTAGSPGDPMWYYDSAHLYKITNYLTGTPGGNGTPTVQTINVTGGTIITSKYAEIRNGKLTGISDFGALNWSVTDLATATVIHHGTIPTPSGYTNPHLNYISQNPNGDIAVVFEADSTDGNRMSMFVTGRAPTDAVNTMRTPVIVRTGTHTSARMGDYCSVMEDPANGTFWAFNQPDNCGPYYTLISNFGMSAIPPAALTQVAGFGMLPSDGTTVKVQWMAAPGATNYQLLRSTDAVKFTTVANLSSATTSYNDTPTAPVSQYYYEVVAGNGLTTSGAAAPVKVVLAPAPPSFNALPAPGNLVAALGTGNGVQLNWSDIAGETGYVIERAGNGVTWAQIGTTAAGVVTYTDANPAGSNLYFYRVSASGSGKNSVPSTVVSIANRPSAPSVTIGLTLDTQVQLRWGSMASPTGFTISRSTDGTNYTQIGTSPANFYSYTDPGLTPMTPYFYRVVANGVVGDSLPGTATVTPRLVAPTVTVAQGTNQLSVSWTSIAGANSYDLQRSTDNINFTTLATQAGTSYADTTAAPLVEYYYRVVASDTTTGDSSLPSAADFGVVPGTVPAGWTATDIGVSGIGAAGFSPNTYTIFGNGSDIWGTADQFHFVSHDMDGDGIIIARVATQQNTSGWAKAGVMIRETTADDSAHALMAVTPSNGTALQWRAATGAASNNNNTGGPVAPYWVKLVRSGDTLTAYRSANGTSWTQQGTPQVIPMADAVKIGLAVTSANSNALCKVTFDNVSLLALAADSLVVNPGAPGTVNVLANDLVPSGTTLTVTGVTQGSEGSVVNHGDGTVTYTANSNATGRDTFTYTVSDGQGFTATANVSVLINISQAWYKMNEGSGTTTADASGNGFTGTITGATWTTGMEGTGGLAFNGTSSRYVSIPALNLNSNTVTIAGWVKRSGTQNASSGIVFTRASSAACGLHFGSANELRYTWNDAGSTYNWNSGLVPPDGQWTFVALVITPTDGTLYLQPLGGSMTSATNPVANTAAAFNGVTRIGGDSLNTARYINASVDDVRIYNASLSAGEIASLAKVTPTVDLAAAASPSVVTGTTTALSALGSSNFYLGSSLTYTWSATSLPAGAGAPTFSANGTNAAKNATATFGKAGNYTLQVTITDPAAATATSSVNVTVNQTPTAVAVAPASALLGSHGSQPFTATANDQFGTALPSQPGFTWSNTGAGSVNTSGLYTASYASGAATVTATSGTLSGSANVTITNAAPTVATAAGASPTTVIGTTTNLSALGADADGGGEPSLTYTWAATAVPSGASAPTYSANGTNGAKNTTATVSKAGTYTFRVTMADAGGSTVTSSVNVTVNQTLTSVTVTPGSATLASHNTQQFTASGADQFGAAMSPAVTWTNTGAGSVNGTGLYTAAYAAGTATVTATSGAVSGSANVTITNAAPTVATAAGASPATVIGTTTNLSALGADADGGGEPSLTYTWAATTIPSGATAPTYSANGTNAAKNTTATFTSNGAYTFTVTIADAGGLTVTSAVNVTVSADANGTWANAAGGSWPTNANWTGGLIATGLDKTANFSTLDLSADATVTLDGARTLGNLVFGDTTPSNNWSLSTGTGGPLTLDVSAGMPTITVNNQSASISTILAGTKGLRKTGAGTLTLGAVNTFTGGLVVDAGLVRLQGGSYNRIIPVATPITINGGTVETIDVNSLYGNDVTVNASGTLKFSAVHAHPANLTLAGGAITTSGTGKYNGDDFQLDGSLTTNGTIASTMALGNGFSSKNSPAITVADATGNAAADLTISGAGSIHNPDTGTTSFTKAGAGTMVLANSNTYTGTTTVSAGTLRVNGAITASAVTVQNSATLDGTGTLGGTVAVQAGGTLAPGAGGIGTLTINNTLGLVGTTAMEISKSGATLTADRVTGVTTLTYGGTLLVSNVGPDALLAGHSFQLFAATTYSGSFTTLTLPVLAAGLVWDTSRLSIDGTISVSGTLPGSWTGADIGAVGLAGGASESAGTFTVSGSGADIWGPADAFQFVSQTLTGNGEIRARVTSQTNPNVWAKAGVMIRDGTTAGATNVLMAVTPGNGFAFQSRTAAGGTTTNAVGPALNPVPNNWVRLTRSGTLFTSYVSADGVTWTPVGSATITMASTVNVGLAVSSHDNANVSTATFDNVAITPYPAPWLSADVGTTGLVGRAEYFGGVHTVSGAGSLGGTTDGFRYVYQTLSGDGSIVARVQTLQNTGTSAAVGVMIRDTLTNNSRMGALTVTGSGAWRWQRRTATGGNVSTTTSSSGTAPNIWVRLVRSGNSVTASRSTDGVTWTTISAVNINMAANCFIGLAVDSGSTTTLNTSAMDNVIVVP